MSISYTFGDSCFANNLSLSEITIPDTITSLGLSCFYNCTSLPSLSLPNSLKNIGADCFYNCDSIVSISIPNSVTNLGNSCFANCDSLSEIIIPRTITDLGISCFANCTNLHKITFEDITSISNFPIDMFAINTQTIEFVFLDPTNSSLKFTLSDITSTAFTTSYPAVAAALTQKISTAIIYNPSSAPSSIPHSTTCFLADSLVNTDQGIVKIQDIDPKYHTINNNSVIAVTKNIQVNNYLVCIKKDALGLDMPNQDTFISKNHKLMFNNEFIEAYKLLDLNENIFKVEYNNQILYNVLLKEYQMMIINNLIVETLHPENPFAKLFYLNNLTDEEKNVLIEYINSKKIIN